MISQEQYEEWMREVEQRPGSSSLILRYVFNRLRDLTSRNEDLLNENISLRSERKVEEYESRITNLEYQLDLLKRQFTGGTAVPAPDMEDDVSLIVYDPQGHLLRVVLPTGSDLREITIFADGIPANANFLRLLPAHRQEELLFVFDTGRTETHPVSRFRPAGEGGWAETAQIEPRTGEQLSAVMAIGRMTLFNTCVQISRRGYIKRMMMASFQQHLSKNYIGSGVKARPDQTCCLVMAGRGDRLVLASREGFLLTTQVDDLPYTSEETLRLSATDYIVTAFTPGAQSSFAIVTQTGKVIHRETGWLENAESNKSRGQAVFSQSRRDAGIRVSGACPVQETDWAAVLRSDGIITLHPMTGLLNTGAVPGIEPPVEILDFAAFPVVERSAE